MSRVAETLSPPSTALISLLLPTRGRPQEAVRFFQSVLRCTHHLSQVEVVLYVDEDDLDSHSLNCVGLNIKKIIGPRLTMGGYNMACLERSSGEIIILVNDDVVIQTEGWDDVVRHTDRRFVDRIYLAYCSDLFKGKHTSTFPILSRHTCDILGAPYPLAYHGAFIDTHLLDIFKRVKHAGYDRICYLENVIFEHLHYRVGKASFDETYRNRGRFEDDAVFLGLWESRKKKACQIMGAIRAEGGAVADQDECAQVKPRNPISALVVYSKLILLDPNLPWRWRLWLWFWFYGRFLVSQGWLRPFVTDKQRKP